MKISHNRRIRNRWDYLWKVLMCEQWKDSKQDLKNITKLMAQAALITKERKSSETRPSKCTSEPSAVSDDRWGRRRGRRYYFQGLIRNASEKTSRMWRYKRQQLTQDSNFFVTLSQIQTVPVPAVKPKKFEKAHTRRLREREDSPQINFPRSAHATKSYTSISHDPHNGLDESFCPLP